MKNFTPAPLLKVFCQMFVFLVSAPFPFSYAESAPTELRWDQLRKYDLKSRQAPKELSQLNGKEVELLGFIIPFEDGKDSAAEFLFVPSPQACIHVPPPPANQIVWVRMKKGVHVPVKLSLVYVSGVFHIMTNDSPVGQVSYFLEGTKVSDSSDRHP